MLVNGRGLTAVVLRVKTDPSPNLGHVQMLLTFLNPDFTGPASEI